MLKSIAMWSGSMVAGYFFWLAYASQRYGLEKLDEPSVHVGGILTVLCGSIVVLSIRGILKLSCSN